jgi:hypothetical protein
MKQTFLFWQGNHQIWYVLPHGQVNHSTIVFKPWNCPMTNGHGWNCNLRMECQCNRHHSDSGVSLLAYNKIPHLSVFSTSSTYQHNLFCDLQKGLFIRKKICRKVQLEKLLFWLFDPNWVIHQPNHF